MRAAARDHDRGVRPARNRQCDGGGGAAVFCGVGGRGGDGFAGESVVLRAFLRAGDVWRGIAGRRFAAVSGPPESAGAGGVHEFSGGFFEAGGCAGKAGGVFRGAYRWPCAAGFRAAVERLSGVQHSDLSRNDQVGGGVGEIAQGDGGADPGRVGGEGCEDALTLRHAANFRADGVLHG